MRDVGLRVAFLCIVLLVCSLVSYAQSQPDFLAVDSAFVKGDYEKTELLALRILQGDSSLRPEVRARLNLTCGYALIMLGHESDARTYFNHALDAVPDLTLDPVQVSPKFRVVFDEVKAARPAPVAPDTNRRVRGGRSADMLVKVDDYYEQPQPRSSSSILRTAMLTNLIVPGSGQWQEGRRLRGAFFFGAQVATVAVLLTRISAMHDSRTDYLAESDPTRISNAYGKYNRDYQWTVAAGIATGLVYLAAQTDLILSRPRQLRMSVGPSDRGLELALRW
jgi:hypothetical protein